MMDSDKLKEILLLHKNSAYNFRERRHEDWTENYTLSRDKVVYNRLTQRQSVNVPLIKYSMKSLLKDIDDPPMLYFNSRNNDSQKEAFYNAYWNDCANSNKLVIKDLVDKKQVMLFGRSFKKLNILNGKFYFEIIDPQDVLVDRYVDPANLDIARFLCHEHIFRPLSSLSTNPMYDQSAVKRLKEFYATQQGLIKAEQNAESLEEKNERMEQLGLIDAQNPELGETYVELNENYLSVYDEELKKDVFIFAVVADGQELLAQKPLHEVIGKTKDDYWMDHTNFVTWGDDPERTDFWSDGIVDGVRTINKIINSRVSQMVENGTLRNFGMQYYDSTKEGYVPQTFEPVPFGWYPFPGNPNEGIKRVDIPELSGNLEEIEFLMGLVEKVTGATSTQQGAIQPTKVTLGEIELALGNAKERVKSLAPLYLDSWKEFGTKYIKLLEGAGDMIDAVKIFKKGNNTKHIYEKVISPNDWESELGYEVEVKDLTTSAGQDSDRLQKLNAAKTVMPMNVALNDIYKQKLLEYCELTATEVKQVMEAEKNTPLMLPPMNQPVNNQPKQQPAMAVGV